MEAAQACAAAGGGAEWTLLVDPDGCWHMLAGAEQEPAALAWTRGASSVFQVRRRGGAIQVAAWQAGERCVLEARAAGQDVRAAFGEQRMYAAGGSR